MVPRGEHWACAASRSRGCSTSLADICTHGCKDYVLNFDDYLKPVGEWPELTCPRVMVTDSDWPAVCHGLVASGVCTLIPEEEVFMTKSSLSGDVDTLPAWSTMSPFFLQPPRTTIGV